MKVRCSLIGAAVLFITGVLLMFSISAAYAFDDNFNDGNMNGWIIDKDDLGQWSVKDGKLRVEAKDKYTRIMTGDAQWTDYVFEVTATKVSGKYPCLLFRINDFETCYDYEASYGSNTLAVFKGKGDLFNSTEITPGGQGARPPFPGGDTHVYKVEVKGKNIKCYLDDKVAMDFNDEQQPYLSGGIGLASYSNSVIDYDDVKVSGTGVPGAVDQSGKLATTWSYLKAERENLSR